MPVLSAAELRRHIVIENPFPCVDGGRYPAKRLAGNDCVVEADIFRDGGDIVRAVIQWKLSGQPSFSESRMDHFDNDRWRGAFPLKENGDYIFTIQAWTDRFATWLNDFRKRVAAGQDVASEAAEGCALIEDVMKKAAGRDKADLGNALDGLKRHRGTPSTALDYVAAPAVEAAMLRLQPRWDAVTLAPELRVWADRPQAEVGAWYEFFIRSEGTFADAEKRLPDIRAMGFDVVYLAPIHPIGVTARKGRNNALAAQLGEPGCPWAIGNEHGGHDAIDPALGTFADFDRFVARARSLKMEVALDFAVQCSPDHPWVRQHPAWFNHRVDGTIRCAESPPMVYEDIYPLNFDSPVAAEIWTALRDVVLFWVGRDVKMFRVDNPHTKAIAFWEWMIAEVRKDHPDVIFLAEAFTRPKIMKALAKAGFSQSYTYFTWRNEKQELMDYVRELAAREMSEYYRPNFFANTPDVLHSFLQTGGPAAFRIRAFLAATLSPTWGIYSGFELCEGAAIPGTEEYLDSEKFEIKRRDWNAPGNIREFISRLNAARNENPALRSLQNVEFLDIDNSQMIGFIKANADRTNVLIGVVSLDRFNAQEAWVRLPMEKLGLPWDARFEVRDLVGEGTFSWSDHNWVRLDPVQPAHLFRVERRVR